MTEGTNKLIRNSTAEFLIFMAQTGDQSIETRYADETVLYAVTRGGLE